MFLSEFCTVAFFILFCGPVLQVLASEEILQQILNDTFYDYDKNVRPSYGVRPVEVTVSIHIVSIQRVDTVNQEFTIDIYLQQTWSDQRLVFSRPRVSNVTLEAEHIRRTWMPDVHFYTDRSNNVMNEQVILKNNGEIQKSTRLTITLSCPMTLEDYPFDNPVCPLHVESFSGPVQDIVYVWAKSPRGTVNAVSIAEDAAIGDFSILNFRLKSNDTPAIPPGVGMHSRLTLEIQLKRILGRYENDFSIFTWIVILSIATLWIGNSKLSVALSIVNLLALQLLKNFQISQMRSPKYNWLDCYARLSSTFIVFVILANLFELNMPEQLESELAKEQKEDILTMKQEDEENRRENPTEEDTKLCRNSDSSTKKELNPVDYLLILKSKLEFAQQQFFIYAQIALPYLRWGLLAVFVIANCIFWKCTPTDKPLVSD